MVRTTDHDCVPYDFESPHMDNPPLEFFEYSGNPLGYGLRVLLPNLGAVSALMAPHPCLPPKRVGVMQFLHRWISVGYRDLPILEMQDGKKDAALGDDQTTFVFMVGFGKVRPLMTNIQHDTLRWIENHQASIKKSLIDAIENGQMYQPIDDDEKLRLAIEFRNNPRQLNSPQMISVKDVVGDDLQINFFVLSETIEHYGVSLFAKHSQFGVGMLFEKDRVIEVGRGDCAII